MSAESKEGLGSNEDKTHRSERSAVSVRQVDEDGQDETNATSNSVVPEQSTSTSVQMPMTKNIEENVELLHIPSKPCEDPGNKDFEPPKSATAPISVQIIDETGHDGVSDTPDPFSLQPTPSTSVQMQNEGKIFLCFCNSYTT